MGIFSWFSNKKVKTETVQKDTVKNTNFFKNDIEFKFDKYVIKGKSKDLKLYDKNGIIPNKDEAKIGHYNDLYLVYVKYFGYNFFDYHKGCFLFDDWLEEYKDDDTHEYTVVKKRMVNQTFDLNDSNLNISLKIKTNIMLMNGSLLFDKWYDEILGREHYFLCSTNNHEESISLDGKPINDETWENSSSFGVGNIRRLFRNRFGKNYNLMDEHGKIILNEWYSSIVFFNSHNLVQVAKCDHGKSKWNILNIHTNQLIFPNDDEWLDEIDPIYYGDGEYIKAKIRKNNKYNLLTKNGDLVSNMWFDKLDIDKDIKKIVGYIGDKKINITF